MKDLIMAMDAKIEEIEAEVKAVKESNTKNINIDSPIDMINGGSEKEATKAHDFKGWMESGVKNYSEYTKGLPLNGNPALYEAELNTDVLEQAIVNNAILSAIGSRGTDNLDYRRTTLTTRPTALLTAENVNFTAVDETDAQEYATIAGRFTKMYAFPRLTSEVLSQSDVAVQSNLMKLLSEQFAITMQEEILHGDGTGAGTKDDPNHLRGITNAAIDRIGNYAEALQPAATRDRETFAAVASLDANGIGADAAAVEANLYTLMLTVPERSQATSQFAMNPNTLSYLMQTLKDTQGRSLFNIQNVLQDNGVWTRKISLFGANIILNETIDDIDAGNSPIIFGDFKAAYELLTPNNGSANSIQDPYTIPDTVGFYVDQIFGSTVADHEALAVLVCQA
ncbi:major capsid protein, HK97 family protein [Vibrio ichthyoenteri ATCC 700023]|uniref:Major capsid protein, HK97 family protein n=1 Tax=Vibrio ichthyoenteri ATCC 700023 TaxID=870968 RepID=F9S5P3_9VIBR|nr:phage major capsid protein [Vibrio ichthyoenteri]EGU35572.1 major capsid protein, HK97 family protein [Vibrio ichthyoenteri ATCC 700023]